MSTKESLQDIGESIQQHRKHEVGHTNICAIGRAKCNVVNELYPGKDGEQVFWITNREDPHSFAYKGDGVPVYKNTYMGGILSKYHSGTRSYTVKTKLRRTNNVTVDIYNRATYSLTNSSANEVSIYLDNEPKPYRFQNLSDLINKKSKLEKELAALRLKQEKDRKEREEAARLAEEKRKQEIERLATEEAERKRKESEEEERKRKEEEELRLKKEQDEIDALERKVADASEDVKEAQNFIRQGDVMRSQHILDESQEDAKRSHLYDGVPIVIEGGPGTGKTTTMIQRLKFLISAQALEDYDAPLSEEQINELTDYATRNKNWLFFSPTRQLLGFLRQNMTEEDLNANDQNTTVLDQFCSDMLISYKLRNPETDGPFKLYKQKGENEAYVIKDAHLAIISFERFILDNIKGILNNAYNLKTNEFSWHKLAVEIKSFCKRGENAKDLDSLANLFNSMKDHELSKVKVKEKELSDELKKKANIIKNKVLDNSEISEKAKDLFDKWLQETIVVQEDDVDADDMDEGEVDEAENAGMSKLDFETKLFQQVQPILRKLGLKEYDSKQKLTKRQNDLYTIIKEYVDEVPVNTIGSLAWFSKKYAFLCRGVESNILNQIPRLYKLFRKDQIKRGSTAFDLKLLEKIDKKDNGKRLHREELELIIGVINHMLLAIYKKSRLRFEGMKKNKYVDAYCSHVKHVIGIDEATDYSLIDYYFISSFLHYEYSSLTLCGDSMQGLNPNGIRSWNELKKYLFPNLEVFELKISYRQIPTLLNMSKQIYKDSMGKDAPYDTSMEKSDKEPSPIYFISDDMEEKATWMSERIIEVMKYYGDTIPSIAILVGDDVDIKELVEEMNDQDYLNGVQIFDCSEGRTATSSKAVKIFRLKEVKGMEFEVAFFYDIDEALAGQSVEMMRRYLYVGISRATSHLAATFTKEGGNEDIIKYFDQKKHDWKL